MCLLSEGENITRNVHCDPNVATPEDYHNVVAMEIPVVGRHSVTVLAYSPY